MTAPGPGPLAAVVGIPRFLSNELDGFRHGWETYGDVYHVRIAGRDLWVCSGPEQAKEVLVDGRDTWQRIRETRWGKPFGLRLALGEGLLTTDGATWQWRRRTINPAFHRELVDRMTRTMVDTGKEMAVRLGDAADNGEPVDLLAEMKIVTQDIISRTMFSSDFEHEAGEVGAAVDQALEYVAKRSRAVIDLPVSLPSPSKRRFNHAMGDVDAAVDRSIARRRESGENGTDLLGLLLSATDGETGRPLDDPQIRSEVATIYGAGHDTTASALAWAWHELMQSPEALTRLQEEVDRVDVLDVGDLEYARMVFEETLRLRPPVPINGRVAAAPTRIGGYEVAKGGTALIVVSNIHRHPDHWDDPEVFDPSRHSPEARENRSRYAFIPFGAGPHLCIGSNFAMIEGVVLLTIMAREFTFRPAARLPRSQSTAVTMKPEGGLPVRATRR